MRRNFRLEIVTMLAIGGVLVSVASPAAAHEKAFKSRVTIKVVDEVNWKGRVTSESKRCIAGRTVKVFTSDGLLVTTAKTNENGRWRTGLIGERYYARVTREVRGGPGHRHVCKPDRSPTRSAPPTKP
jgi:hypothetical protein